MVEQHENGKDTRGRAPVYVPFKTFQTAVSVFSSGGLPPDLDRSVWPSLSGGVQSQMMSAFRFLGLIADDGGKVTDSLRRLVEASEGSGDKVVMADIMRDRYGAIYEMSERNETFAKLQEALRSQGVRGSTLDRAVRFLFEASDYCGIPLTPIWHTTKRSATPSGKRSKRRQGSEDNGVTPEENQTPPIPKSSGNSRTLELRSGGTLTLSVSVDLLALSVEDRDFVFGVADRIAEYKNSPSGSEMKER